jgi:hypothetical protein
MKCSRKFVKVIAYIMSASLFVFMYLSLVDAFSEKMAAYEDSQ